MPDNLEEEIKKMVAEVIEVPVEKLDLDADFFRDIDVQTLIQTIKQTIEKQTCYN